MSHDKSSFLQLFVPNARAMYGSDCKTINIRDSTVYYAFSNDIYIAKTHVKALDQPTQRCSQENAVINTSACIADFVDRQLGCSPDIIGTQYSNRTLCTTKAQLLAYANISRMLGQSDGNDIYDITGCLSSCEKNQYSLSLDPIQKEDANPYIGEQAGQLHLKFIMSDSTYKEEEQYVIYDMNSFVADVGGYMGLLLGSSLLSLYHEIEAVLTKTICRPFRGKTQVRRASYKIIKIITVKFKSFLFLLLLQQQ